MNLKSLIPWYARIGAKVVLARLPLPYAAWHRLHLYRHGAMLDFGYAERVFETHLAKSGLTEIEGLSLLELGPGDSLLSAVFARLRGAAHTTLVDAGRFAAANLDIYREVVRRAPSERFRHELRPEAWSTLGDMLDDCHATYLTDGLRSLRTLPADSVDFSFSQAVLEHVKLAEFPPTMVELHRAAVSGGLSSHQVDLRDHLGGRLNSLRFAESTWEGSLFANSGFYTNRMRMNAVVDEMRNAGFSIETLAPQRWPSVPTPRTAMAPAFRTIPDDELTVFDFYVRLRKP